MLTFRTIIVDHDDEVRQKLVGLLGDRSEVEILGEFKSGSEAIESINNDHPDLVFLKVELPDINGFQVISQIDSDYKPLVIFVSAMKDYALEAFEVEALDYILTPIKRERIEQSLDRAQTRYHNGVSEALEGIGKLIPDVKQPHNLDRFIIKQGGEYHLIRTSDIIWIEADGNYSRIMTQDKKFMVRYTLSGFDEQLNPERFYRISRSQIVNLEYVAKIKDHIYGNYLVELTNGMSLKMSKNYKQLFEVLKNF